MPRPKLARPVSICNCQAHAWTVLTLGYVALVSPEDAHFLKSRKWTAAENKRKTLVYVRSTYTKLHREILDAPPKILVDHKNGNGLDNQRGNIRLSTNKENARNIPRHRDCSSRFKGVCWLTKPEMWLAQICKDGHRMHLGVFEDEIEAAKTYDTAALKLFGEFARLNFPHA
jgi:hypothetical protein